MKIRYSEDSDILTITFKDVQLADSIDLKEGVILHIDKEGHPVELEILDASKFVQLEEISFSSKSLKALAK